MSIKGRIAIFEKNATNAVNAIQNRLAQATSTYPAVHRDRPAPSPSPKSSPAASTPAMIVVQGVPVNPVTMNSAQVDVCPVDSAVNHANDISPSVKGPPPPPHGQKPHPQQCAAVPSAAGLKKPPPNHRPQQQNQQQQQCLASYDTKFFQQWTQQLNQKLSNSLPNWSQLPGKEDLEAACLAVQSAQKAKLDAQAVVDQLSRHQPNNKAEIEKAQQAVKEAADSLQAAVDTCQQVGTDLLNSTVSIKQILSPDFDDADLITYIILKQGGADRLAKWCQRGETEQALLIQFLYDVDLQRTFMQAGGAKQGEYGRATELYSHMHPQDPVLQRLALAVALELAAPLTLFDSKKLVDPLQRYVHYEQAYLFGELDPVFSEFSVWEMRHVVNSDAPDEELGWGRQSLMNYRPDLVISDDPQWRYCFIVRTDVAYKAPDWYKQPKSYDQILAGGGKCGPRAWYGRFICKAFGIPTWGVRQPGHAAMTRWTTKGWMTCLGAGFQFSNWENRGGLDFLLETQARNALGNDTLYMQQVNRLEWLANLRNEDNRSILNDCLPQPNALWYAMSLMQRKQLAGKNPAQQERKAAFPSSTMRQNKIQAVYDAPVKATELMASNDRDGTIIIPAAACTIPAKPNNKPVIMRSFLGGQQLFMAQDSTVEYTLSTTLLGVAHVRGSCYMITMRVATAHRDEQPLLLSITPSTSGTTIQIPIPYTMALWKETDPVKISFPDANTNTKEVKLSISRQNKQFGIAIKDLKLVPVEAAK